MKSVLITGSSGYLGYYVLNHLIDLDLKCYVFLRNKLYPCIEHKNVIPIYSLDPVHFSSKYPPVDAILHIGGPASQDCSDHAVQQCMLQAKLLVSFLSYLKIPKLIFFSSIHVYGDSLQPIVDEESDTCPSSNYGILKLNLEKFFRTASVKYSFDFTALRLSNIIAPPFKGFSNWHLVFHSFLHSCFSTRSIVIKSNPLVSRDFVAIEFFLFILLKY